MKRKKLPSSNVELPIELVREILVRLPVQSLLRFRHVCKSWNSLISSSDFAYLHLARCYNNNNNDDDDENTPVLSILRGGAANWCMLRSSHTFRKIPCHVEIKCPQGYDPRGTSVSGLLLLCKSHLSDQREHTTEIMLWNPIIGKVHRLPNLGFSNPTLALGFNSTDNDYKVVAIARRPRTSVHLYTLSTGTWRSIDSCRQSIYGVHSDGVLIEGSIYWMVDYDDEQSLMVSFDVKDEVFGYRTLPIASSWRTRRYLVAYRDRVGLLDFLCCENNSCSLWVMEKGEDQVPGTWSKIYTVNLYGMDVPHVLCFKQNGQLILASKERGVELWNMETKHMQHLMKSYSFYRQWTSSCFLYTTLYRESLILL